MKVENCIFFGGGGGLRKTVKRCQNDGYKSDQKLQDIEKRSCIVINYYGLRTSSSF